MKVIHVIENYFKCKITEVTFDLPNGKVAVYKTETKPAFTASVNSLKGLMEIKYLSENEISDEKMQFAGEIISCFTEYSEQGIPCDRPSPLLENLPSEQNESREALFVLGSYAAAIVHEIKNPLISIGGFAKRIFNSINEPRLQKMARIISSESQRLERLAEEILSYTRNQEPQKTAIDLTEEMDDIKSLFEIRSADSHISLNFDIPKDAVIYADKNQFHQVVVNLVANAMAAIGERGSINIIFNQDNSLQTLTVSDTGGGIPEENLPKLFEPFFTTSPKGTGLGLVISKKIMNSHGGDITVKNGKEGAEITLTLPRHNI